MSLNVLVLYDNQSTFTNTVKEHLESFCLFSKNHIFYTCGTHNALYSLDLSLFDAVIIHYSVRLCFDWHISPFYAESIRQYSGFKLLFIQDEYEMTETARNWIEHLGIRVVFTCVPNQYKDSVYSASRFPNTEFIQTLTGWVPIYLENNTKFSPIAERKYVIGYRGRALPYWYGNLGQEKLMIGKMMRYICEEKNIPVDIEWDDEKRIYGDKWYEFIGSCKAVLGTESGSNVFDDYGHLRKNIQLEFEENPSITYEEIYTKYLAEHEGKILMNQISPKIFEAIALKTALVLFEGSYSGVIQPHIHYIPLKKDFSNVEQVLNLLNNNKYLEDLTERAYQDIIKSGKYSYKQFVSEVDQLFERYVTNPKNISQFLVQESIQAHFHTYKLELERQQLLRLEELQLTLNSVELQAVSLQSSNLELHQTINSLQSSNLELHQTINSLQSSNLELHQTINSLQLNNSELQQTINALLSSKFWKLRKYWFKLKNFVGFSSS